MQEPNVFGIDRTTGKIFDCGKAEARLGDWDGFGVDFEKDHYFFAYPVLLPLDPQTKLMVYYPYQDKLAEFPYSEHAAAMAASAHLKGVGAPVFFYMEV